MRTLSAAILAVAWAVGVQGADPPAVRMPEFPAPVVPPPGAAATLSKGQWYLVSAANAQLVEGISTSGGAVTVVGKKGPLTVPADVAVGWKPDADDPEVCTIPGPFVYIVKAAATGPVILTVTPTVKVDAAGKAVPLTHADVIHRVLTVDAQNPIPPPKELALSALPMSGVSPLTVQFNATGDLSSGVTIDFGDNTSLGNAIPTTHLYAFAGTYTAKLTTGTGKTATTVVTVSGTVPVLTPFQQKLQTAFRADGATLAELKVYAALWRNAAKTTVYDTGLATPAALLAEMQAAALNLSKEPNPSVRHGALNKTARAVADELNPLMPKPANGALTPPVRDSVSALFTRIAQDLEVIK